MKYELKKPITLPDGEKITGVSITDDDELDGDILFAMIDAEKEGRGTQTRLLIASATGLPEDVVGKMKASDIKALADILEKKMPTEM